MEHQRKDANIIFASLFIQTAGCEQTEYWKNKIHIEDVWKETYGNENIIVGIIDSGIDITSSDLQSVITIKKFLIIKLMMWLMQLNMDIIREFVFLIVVGIWKYIVKNYIQ